MHLPEELRNRIYEYALVPNRPIDIWPIIQKEITATDDHSVILRDNLEGINVNLLEASRQIHSEAIGIFYGSNAFRFSDDHASIALTLFFEHIGSNCRYITNISAHISFHDKCVDMSSWESALRHFNLPFLDDELAVLCRRLGRFEFNSILGPSCHT